MRVITGSARGRKLKTLDGEDVRPTTDKVKEALFSVIQFEVEGAAVLDLFAGSGQLGIEALSRGANHAVFVDAAAKSLRIVQENLETTGLIEAASLVQRNAMDYLTTCTQQFDLAFLDPPYRKEILEQVLPVLAAHMTEDGKIFCECEQELSLPEKIPHFYLKKEYKYGKIKLALYCTDEDTE